VKPLATQVERCCMELDLKIEDMRVWTEWIDVSRNHRKYA